MKVFKNKYTNQRFLLKVIRDEIVWGHPDCNTSNPLTWCFITDIVFVK